MHADGAIDEQKLRFLFLSFFKNIMPLKDNSNRFLIVFSIKF